MSKVVFINVDEYLSSHPPLVQEVLEEVRSAIRAALPEAVEVVSYNSPLTNWEANR